MNAFYFITQSHNVNLKYFVKDHLPKPANTIFPKFIHKSVIFSILR